jgi:hypothetical protein
MASRGRCVGCSFRRCRIDARQGIVWQVAGRLFDILRAALAEGPIGQFVLAERDEDVIGGETGIGGQVLGDLPVEVLLHGRAAATPQEDLDEDHIRTALDVEVIAVEDQVIGGLLADDLKAVIGGNIEGLGQSVMNTGGDGLAIGERFAGGISDANERHDLILSE